LVRIDNRHKSDTAQDSHDTIQHSARYVCTTIQVLISEAEKLLMALHVYGVVNSWRNTMEQGQADSGQPSTQQPPVQHPSAQQPSMQQKGDEKRADNDSRTTRSFASSGFSKLPLKEPGARQRWNEYRPSKTSVFWSLLAVVALTMLLGFTWGGWRTASGAQKLADASAKAAVTQRLAPICVAQFNLDPARDEKLMELQEASAYQQGVYVKDQMWATMPGETEANSQVATECAQLLMQLGQ
jgi:hypothetical protein